MPDFSKILILGSGLLGGSLGMAVKQNAIASHIALWGRRQESLDEALAMNAADSIHTEISLAARDADMVVLATPTRTFPDIARQLQKYLYQDAIITDVGSVKAPVCAEMQKIFHDRFIGSHPMAGSEKSGVAHARPDLFRNATCIITPTEKTSQSAADAADTLWQGIGSRTVRMSPEEHDNAVAYLSHLPHIIAAALVNSVMEKIPSHWQEIAGPGFRDTTRIASGPPQMWSEILSDNRAAIAPAIASFLSELEKMSSAMRQKELSPLAQLLASAKDSRASIIRSNITP